MPRAIDESKTKNPPPREGSRANPIAIAHALAPPRALADAVALEDVVARSVEERAIARTRARRRVRDAARDAARARVSVTSRDS